MKKKNSTYFYQTFGVSDVQLAFRKTDLYLKYIDTN